MEKELLPSYYNFIRRSKLGSSPFKHTVWLKNSDRRLKEFQSRYPWFTYDYCLGYIPTPTLNSLSEVIEHKVLEYPTKPDELIENSFVKISKAPKASELKSLLSCDREYGVVWDRKRWYVIIGSESRVPFHGKSLPENGIFIHNHPLHIREGLSKHQPYPSYFDLIQVQGRHFLVSRLGITKYRVLDEDQATEDSFGNFGTHDRKPRFLKMKLDKEALLLNGIIQQEIRWANCGENFFAKLTCKI